MFYKYSNMAVYDLTSKMGRPTRGNLRSIWDNDFYNQPPALGWTFKAVFNDFMSFKTDDTVLIDENDMELLNKAVVSVNIPDRKVNTADLYYGGLNFKIPTRAENSGTITFKFNEDSLYRVTTILEKIYHIQALNKFYYSSNSSPNNAAAYAYGTDTVSQADSLVPKSNSLLGIFKGSGDTSGNVSNKNTKPCIISLKIFNQYRDPTTNSMGLNDGDQADYFKQYKFYECKLVSIPSISYNYESDETIQREAIFTYNWMDFNTKYNERTF